MPAFVPQQGCSTGRVVTFTATDACGNASSPVTIGAIFVPHDQRGHLTCQRPTYGRMGD